MKHLDTKVFKTYRQMVEKAYPAELDKWPIISGYNLKFGKYRTWYILVFEHTGNPIPLKMPLEHLTAAVVGVDDIGSNTELARKKLTRYLCLSKKDMLVLLNSRAANLEQELALAFKQHETLLKKQANITPQIETPKPRPVPEKAEPIKAPDKPAAEPAAELKALPQKENKVLIIHGCNEKIKKSLCNFLLSLGLQAVEWAEALLMTGKPDPDNSDVLKSIFEHCQAVVILLTNDKHDLTIPEECSGLRFLPQAELNSLFIAGMAAGIDHHRTVITGLGNLEPFRSIPGLYITGLDNTLKKRKDFIERLRNVGCEIKTKGRAWQISGDFDIELKPVFPEKQLPPQPVDEPAKETRGPQIPPEPVTPETLEKLAEDTSLEKPPAGAAAEIEPATTEQPPKGRSLIDSLPIINILKPKRQPKKEKPAPDPVIPPQSTEKAEPIPEAIKTPAPVVKKHAQKKQEPVAAAQQPEPKPPTKKDKKPSKEPHKPIEEPASKKADGELSPEESEFMKKIKELEAKLEILKNRSGRSNQRAIDNLEKQIQNEKYRLRTIRQLANIENIRKSYEEHKKVKREDK